MTSSGFAADDHPSQESSLARSAAVVFTSSWFFVPVSPQGGPQQSLHSPNKGPNSEPIHMMTKHCAVAGCTSMTIGYSRLCRSHRATQVRHGHPLQTGVTGFELRPHLRMVESRQAKSPESPAWAIIKERWSRVVEQARQTIGLYASGMPSVRHQVQAAEQVRSIADVVPPDRVMQTALAMFLMLDAEPRRFRSDQAFTHQLVRMVRKLAPTSHGSYWDPKTRRAKKVYRDLPPRTAAVLAPQLVEAFGAAGLQLAGVERRAKVDHAAIERQRLADAIEALA
jgi:hypothetical protein